MKDIFIILLQNTLIGLSQMCSLLLNQGKRKALFGSGKQQSTYTYGIARNLK